MIRWLEIVLDEGGRSGPGAWLGTVGTGATSSSTELLQTINSVGWFTLPKYTKRVSAFPVLFWKVTLLLFQVGRSSLMSPAWLSLSSNCFYLVFFVLTCFYLLFVSLCPLAHSRCLPKSFCSVHTSVCSSSCCQITLKVSCLFISFVIFVI